MLELVFLACLVAEPDDCGEKRLLYVNLTPLSCMMGAQTELAKWTERHPRYRVASWKCRWLRAADLDA